MCFRRGRQHLKVLKLLPLGVPSQARPCSGAPHLLVSTIMLLCMHVPTLPVLTGWCCMWQGCGTGSLQQGQDLHCVGPCYPSLMQMRVQGSSGPRQQYMTKINTADAVYSINLVDTCFCLGAHRIWAPFMPSSVLSNRLEQFQDSGGGPATER